LQLDRRHVLRRRVAGRVDGAGLRRVNHGPMSGPSATVTSSASCRGKDRFKDRTHAHRGRDEAARIYCEGLRITKPLHFTRIYTNLHQLMSPHAGASHPRCTVPASSRRTTPPPRYASTCLP
jgi:hypothetical protein